MNKIHSFFLMVLLITSGSVMAQESAPAKVYDIKDITVVKHTSVKNQGSSGTCWCFAGMGLVEAELLRKYGKEFDLSEMYAVRGAWTEKIKKHVRMHGNSTLSQGGEVIDAIYMIEQYGMVPESEYTGMVIGESRHMHGEMNDVLTSFAKAVLKKGNGKLSPVWQDALPGLLDTYLGEVPQNFVVDGKQYDAKTFAEAYPINAEDYVQIASFLHRAEYAPFIVEIPDNWTWTSAYNMPMDELMQALDYALESGYAVGWAQDVSTKGFTRKGIGIVPQDDIDVLCAICPDCYENKTAKEIRDGLYSLTEVVPEKVVTPEMHQQAYDNWDVTDDHSMLIVGIAQDQKGTKYYKVKNSWGTTDMDYGGYWYCSESYVRLHTIFFTLNKEALTKDMRKNLGL